MEKLSWREVSEQADMGQGNAVDGLETLLVPDESCIHAILEAFFEHMLPIPA